MPLVSNLIDDMLKNKLKENEFPYINSTPTRDVPNKVIVFVIGGVTFSEARFVQQVNKNHPDTFIVLGGSSILNAKDFYFKYL